MKGLYQELESQNKGRFGIKIAFNSTIGHADTMGICTYEDMKEYGQFTAEFDFGGYSKTGVYENIDSLIADAKTIGCKKCKVWARRAS